MGFMLLIPCQLASNELSNRQIYNTAYLFVVVMYNVMEHLWYKCDLCITYRSYKRQTTSPASFFFLIVNKSKQCSSPYYYQEIAPVTEAFLAAFYAVDTPYSKLHLISSWTFTRPCISPYCWKSTMLDEHPEPDLCFSNCHRKLIGTSWPIRIKNCA